MPTEVIDLLSSSEASSSPKVRSLSVTSPINLDLCKGYSQKPRSDCSNVANSVAAAGHHPALPNKESYTSVAKKRSSDVLDSSKEISLDSDDLDTSVDLSCEVIDTDDRSFKRARVIAGNEASLYKSQTFTTDVTGTCAIQERTVRRNKAFSLDPIEFTSSPDPVSDRKKGKGRATIVIDDGNPFASSSHTLHWNENKKPSGPSSKQSAAHLFSDFEDPFASSSPLQPSKPPPVRAEHRTTKQPIAWDPISSSIPEVSLEPRESLSSSPLSLPTTRKLVKAPSAVINLLDSDGASFASLASDNSLPDVNELTGRVKTGPNAKYSFLGKGDRTYIRPSSKSLSKERSAATKSKTESAVTAYSDRIGSEMIAAGKAIEKQEKAALRKAESERKRLDVEQARLEKKLKKERAKALAEVNKIRTDRKKSSPEMIIDLPNSMDPKIKLQAEALLRDFQVDCHSYSSPVNNIVRWRRKVTAVYNEEIEQWEPVPLRLVNEQHVMVLMPAAEFVELARGDVDGQVCGAEEDPNNEYMATSTLEGHISRMQAHFPNSKLIYLIEGMAKWMRSNRKIQNRQFTAGVRSLAAQVPTLSEATEGPRGPNRRKRPSKQKKTRVYVEENIIEDALMQLQVIHSALIHHVDTELETAQWISVFTQHISTIPYRRSRDATNDRVAFCMDAGQVRTGDDAADAYVRMLQQLTRVTPAIAYGIAAEYPTVSQLVGGFESRGALMLEGCRKSTNKDGAFSERTIGQAISRRLYKVFTSRDEASTDV